MTTEQLIKDYYQCWVDNDREKVRLLLVDDLSFVSPDDRFSNADDFLTVCWKFAEGFNSLSYIHEVYDESSGYVVYIGEGFCCGELLKIRQGKIAEIYVTYNPSH